MEGWCEMRTDEYFSQLLLEMTTDEDRFAVESGTTPPEIDANNNKHDELATIFLDEELQSIADAVRYYHVSSSKKIKVSLPPYLVHIVLCFCFYFCFFLPWFSKSILT
jgi:hypothetical protein